MLGTYRVILALMVVFQHLGRISQIGSYAVFAFFVISGYLMTFILKENYGYSISGKIKYFLNRFLRIYPQYWGALVVSLLLIFLIDQEVIRGVSKQIVWFRSTEDFLRNIFIIFYKGSGHRLIPPSWALSVELLFYSLMAFGISKTKRRTLLWFALGLIYSVYILIIGADWEYQYFFFAAGSLPFSIGALIYHFRDDLLQKSPWLMNKFTPVILSGFLIANYLISGELFVLKKSGFYMNLLLSAIMVASLINQKSLFFITKPLDKKIGEYSYPIYLVHIQAAVLLHFFTGLPEGSITFALLVLPITLVISWIILKTIAQPVEKLRLKVKSDKYFQKNS